MSNELTSFQKSLLTALVSVIAISRDTILVESAGINELFLLCKIKGFEVYLYEDGFNIVGENTDERFEAEDIETIEFAEEKLVSIIFGST